MTSGGFRATMTALLTIMLMAGAGLAAPPDGSESGTGEAAAGQQAAAAPAGQQTQPETKKDGTEAKKTSDEEARQAEVDAALARFSEEMVVTAQLREEKVQDVPVSLTAISGDTLQAIGMQSIEDLPDAVPGLNIVNIAPGSNAFAARGVTNLGGSIETNAVVGYYVDEVPISASGQGPDFALWDVERIEVLRGPQGTLFGEGSMAGTMRIIANKPDTTKLSARVGADTSSTTEGGASGTLRAMVNVPVVENKFAVRVLAGYIDNAGWIDVPDLAMNDANTQKQFDLRVAARWLPSDKWIVDASYMRQKLDLGFEFTGTSPWILYPKEQLAAAGPMAYEEPTHTINQNANVSLTYDLGWASLISATSYFDYTSDWVIDLTPFVPLFFGPTTGGTAKNPPHATSTLWTEEVRLASASTAKVQWTVGAFYKNSDRVDERNFEFYLEHAFGIPGFDLTDIASNHEHSQAKSYSLFGEVDFPLASTVSMQVGLRYYSDERDYSNEQLTSSIIFGTHAGTIQTGTGSDSDFAPKVSLRWEPNASVMMYAKVAKGFKSGGTNYNADLSDLVPEDYSAEELWEYEIGGKTDLSATWIANAAVYYNDWTNLQLGFITPDGLFPYTTNAGAANALGGELEARGRLLVDGLSASLNVAYTDAEITEQVLNAMGGVVAEKGNKIPLTSEWTTGIALDYFTRLSSTLNGMAMVAWAHRTPNFSGADNVTYQENPVYDQVRMSLGVSTALWSLEAYVDNLLNDADSTIKYNRVVAVPLTYISYVRPRTIGLRFDVKI